MPRRPSPSWCAAMFTAMLAWPLDAQTTDDSALLDRLCVADYAQREAATTDLLRNENVDIDRLRALFAQASMPEQRVRLLDAIRHHTLRRLREETFPADGDPAIGFSHDIRRRARVLRDGEEASVVFVVSTLPGFPGYAHLQPGDLITEIDGEPLPPELDNEVFKQRLRTRQQANMTVDRRARHPIALTVLRDGRELSVQLQLATTESLERMYTQSPVLQEPFNARWKQLRDELLETAPPVSVLEVPPPR